MVKDGKGERALDSGNRLAAEMVNKIESGNAGALLGTLDVLRALASYQTGDERLALWHWHIGIQMFPELTDYDLDPYGDAGRFLAEHPFRKSEGEGAADDRNVTKGVTAPRKIRAPVPQVPAARRDGLSREPVSVIVRAVIDQEGRPKDPVILKADGEYTLVCSSLEALWQWSFEPAKLNGEPVEVWYNLTINFR